MGNEGEWAGGGQAGDWWHITELTFTLGETTSAKAKQSVCESLHKLCDAPDPTLAEARGHGLRPRPGWSTAGLLLIIIVSLLQPTTGAPARAASRQWAVDRRRRTATART